MLTVEDPGAPWAECCLYACHPEPSDPEKRGGRVEGSRECGFLDMLSQGILARLVVCPIRENSRKFAAEKVCQ